MSAKRASRRSVRKPKTLRVAVIGTGGISGMHMELLAAYDDAQIVAAADINEKALTAAQQQFDIPRVYKDWKAMLKAGGIDAVSVCTPNGLHAPATIDSLNAGCHVIVEKPMAMNAREAQRMCDAARKHRRHLIIGFQYRFSAAVQMLKRAADAGQFGKIMFVKCLAIRRRGIPNWGVFGRKELQGGGPLIDIGVHAIEQGHYLMGSPKPVAAVGSTWTYMGNKPSKVECMWPGWDHKTYTVEDLAVGHIRFDNGAVMQVESAFACHGPDSDVMFSFMGEKGGGSTSPPAMHTDMNGTMVNITPDYLPTDGYQNHFAVKMRSFVDTALYNKPTEAPAEDGLRVQQILDGIYRSAEAGHEVKIN